MESEKFDINKKVEEIPVEEIEGFFHDIDLSDSTSEESEEQKEEGDQLEKGNTNYFL